MDNYEEIHVKLESGETIYWPKGDIARLAPAAVCQIAQRILILRKILSEHEMDKDLRRKLDQLARPIPFEDKFLSGNSVKVHNAIKSLGAEDIYG